MLSLPSQGKQGILILGVFSKNGYFKYSVHIFETHGRNVANQGVEWHLAGNSSIIICALTTLPEARMKASFGVCLTGMALACLVASVTAGAPGLVSGGRGLRLIDGAHGGARMGSLLPGSRIIKGDALSLRIRGGGGSLPPPVASGPQTPAEGKVKIKLSINYGVEGGSIVAVGPHQSFGNGDIHKGMKHFPQIGLSM